MKNKKKIYILAVIAALGILLFILFKATKTSKGIISISAGNIDFSEAVVTQQIKQELDGEYEIGANGAIINKEDEAKAINFANEVTFLLLGAPGEGQVDYAEYKKREEEFNKIVDIDAKQTKYQRNGIRYKLEKSPEDSRNSIRNRVVNYKNYGKATVLNVSDDIVEVKVYMDEVTVVAENQKNPQEVIYAVTKMELRYYIKNIYGVYRLKQIKYRIGDDIDKELEDAEKKELNNSDSDSNIINTIDTKENKEYDFTKFEEFDETKQKEVYNKTVSNVVLLQAYRDTSMTGSAVGIIISDGFVITSWNFFESALNNAQYVQIIDKDGNLCEVAGVVSIDTKIDAVILKLNEERKSTISIGNLSEVHREDPILSVGSRTGYSILASVGIVAENGNNSLKNLLLVTESDVGGPVFNANGELIGINTNQSINSSISVANVAEGLKTIKEKLDNANFASVKSISFDDLKEKYFYKSKNEEIVVKQIKSKVWDEYKKIGNIESNIPLKLNKASYYNGVVSLRYENEISQYMSGFERAYLFVDELQNQGYEATYVSKTKCIYKNGKYKVTMMEEMGYLIIIMTKI